MSLPIFINIIHILVLRSEISNWSFRAIFDSNLSESREFLEHVLSLKFIFTTIFFWTSSIFLLNYSPNRLKLKIPPRPKRWLFLLTCISYLTLALGSYRNKPPFEKVLYSLLEYKMDYWYIQKAINSRKQPVFTQLTRLTSQETKETYIIVIGESANRVHVSLYGAPLKTTPNFDILKQELAIFKNISSSSCQTEPSLRGVLCLDEDFKKGDIVTLFKQAGFKTFWFSNQYGSAKEFIFLVGSLANQSNFINTSHRKIRRSFRYDGELVPLVKAALQDEAPKKVIFVHLFGSHFKYVNRYPKEFEQFKTPTKDKHVVEVDQYHNTLLYTDHVLANILALLKEDLSASAYFLYFSDHGEDVTTNPQSIHGHSAALATPAMFEISLIVWTSSKYKQLNQNFINSWNLDKKYETNKLLYSIMDLSRINCEQYQDKYSLFTP